MASSPETTPTPPEIAAALTGIPVAACFDCAEACGSPRFPDLVIGDAEWKAISPDGEGNGLLCPNCICARLTKLGITATGVFRSGPLACDIPVATITALMEGRAVAVSVEEKARLDRAKQYDALLYAEAERAHATSAASYAARVQYGPGTAATETGSHE